MNPVAKNLDDVDGDGNVDKEQPRRRSQMEQKGSYNRINQTKQYPPAIKKLVYFVFVLLVVRMVSSQLLADVFLEKQCFLLAFSRLRL